MEVLFIALLVKLLHITFLWFAFYVAEKVALDDFVTAVYVKSIDPPSLDRIVLRVFIADAVFCVMLLAGVYLLLRRSIDEPIIGGMTIIWAIAADLFLSYIISFLISLFIGRVAQSQSCCRYKDDGLRGTRAFCYTALCLSIIICLPPYFLIL